MRAQSLLAPVVVLVISLMMVHQGLAQEDQQARAAAPTTPPVNTMATIAANAAIKDSQLKARLVAGLDLKVLDDMGDAVVCGNGSQCSYIARLQCIRHACEAVESKNPVACFNEFNGDMKLGNDLLCKSLDSPSVGTIKALVSVIPDATEAESVRSIALILAIKGSATQCQEEVKKFVGPYGKKWNKEWFVTMSGCRILAKERTREEEEEDYATWIDVDAGKKACSEIINVEMFNACSAPGAIAPISSKRRS